MKAAFIDDNKIHRELISAYFNEIDVYEVWDENLNNYDIVFVDYILGNDSGLELARKLISENPFQKIYMLTGYDIECEFPVIKKGHIDEIKKIIGSQ